MKAGTAKLTVTASKAASTYKATGYQIGYRISGGSWTYVKLDSTTAKSKAISKLKSGKTYQVRIRAYKTVSSVDYYGAWSAVKSVTVN